MCSSPIPRSPMRWSAPQRAYIIGAAVGQTNVVFFDAEGQQVGAYDIAVKRDLNGVRSALHQRRRACRSKASAKA